MPKTTELYDEDFVLWTEEQAAALRQARDSNLLLDWENLAEEIESLGKSRRLELRSQTRRILLHLFKLEASPSAEPRAGWRSTIRDARVEIEDALEESPSLRREVAGIVESQLPRAARIAEADLEEHGEPSEAVRERLQKGGFTIDEILGDWFPEPRN